MNAIQSNGLKYVYKQMVSENILLPTTMVLSSQLPFPAFTCCRQGQCWDIQVTLINSIAVLPEGIHKISVYCGTVATF